jgi:hypothetical protein
VTEERLARETQTPSHESCRIMQITPSTCSQSVDLEPSRFSEVLRVGHLALGSTATVAHLSLYTIDEVADNGNDDEKDEDDEEDDNVALHLDGS